MSPLAYSQVLRQPSTAEAPSVDEAQDNPAAVASYMLSLMQRNIGTVGYAIESPQQPSVSSVAGCVIASPSYPGYPGNVVVTAQDYVYNWTRDAAITLMALVASQPALLPAPAVAEHMANYVDFARTCQTAGADNGLGDGPSTPRPHPGQCKQTGQPCGRQQYCKGSPFWARPTKLPRHK